MFDGFDPADLLGVRDFARPGLVLDREDPINRGLVGLWTMMESGARITDLSGNRRHLTLFNAPARVSAPFGQATNLASASSQYATPANTTYTQSRSFVAWVKSVAAPASGAGNTWVMTSDDNFGFNWNNNNASEAGAVYFWTSGHGWQVATLGGTSIPGGVWHCLVATCDGGTIRAYRNGVLTGTNTPGSNINAWSNMAIGRNAAAGTGYFNGAVALVRDFNRALTAAEAVRLALLPFAGVISEDDRLYVARGVSAAVPVTSTPGAGAITIQGQGVTVAAGAAVQVGAGALALQGAAPAVAAGVALAIGAGTLALAGAAPSVTAGAVLSLGAGALALAGAAPTVLAGATLSPGAGALAFQGLAPSAAAGAALSPGVATITIQGHAVDLGEPLAPAPAWATLTWPLGDRAVVWAAESRDIAWAAVNRTITWRGSEMPDRVFVIPPAHVEDELPYSFTFEGFGTGDDVASYTVTVPTGVMLLDDSSSGQIVTTQLGATAAGTHRIIVRAISDAGSKATLEADWTVSDPD